MPYRSKFCLVVAILMIVAGSFLLIKPVSAITTDKNNYIVGENGIVDNCLMPDNYFGLFSVSGNFGISGSQPCSYTPDNFFNMAGEEEMSVVGTYAIVEYNFGEEVDLCADASYTDCIESVFFRDQAIFNVVSTTEILTLPDNFAGNLLAYTGRLFTDTSPIILIGAGLPIGFWIIKRILTLFKK